MLSFIKETMWRTMFGKPADSLERVTDKDDECPAHPLRFYPHTARNVRRSPSAARASSTLRHHRGGCGRHDPRQGAASQRLHLGAPRLRQPQLRRLRRRRRPRHARRGSPSPTAGRTGSPGPLATTSLAPANPPPPSPRSLSLPPPLPQSPTPTGALTSPPPSFMDTMNAPAVPDP